jgi:hypothetical protein
MSQLATIGHNARAMHVERIRTLLVEWSKHTMELGQALKEARDTQFPLEKVALGKYKRPVLARPGWRAWLKSEFGISEVWASKLIRIFEKLDRYARSRGSERGLPIATKVLALLTQDATPESARFEIIERARRGERIVDSEARKIITKHYPKPTEAAKRARETGKLVLASDGFYYTGATKEEGARIDRRRRIVFGVRRAVATIASMELSPHQFLAYARPHQLIEFNDDDQLERAAKWLNALTIAWQHHKK